ncbi:hypothetical protein [Bradyrhizobium sp.]|jgi:hypothetical protein|uniref:hypothetical protein n=1 Tax=Bradyrhizobium sp. TaxID=376 RepID=UPI002DF90C40|nr:hypothetical protein [Bradyrhizobium sp.]
MPKIVSAGTDAPASDPYEHGPLRAERIPPGNYTAKFLNDLKVQNQVAPVDENWDPSRSSLPPRVNWVIYPNGDLERVGFD